MVHELARKLIAERRSKIKQEWNPNKTEEENIDSWNFEERRKSHPKECPCYTQGPCHQGKINCLLCFCPEYDLSKEEGGCKRGGEGKWFYHNGKKIWDCSDCSWPHQRDNIKKHLKHILE